MRVEEKYMRLLAKEFPNVQAASTELINLSAILNLPKGTEHFIADIHGEYDAFNHFLKNASGIIKEKINQQFTHLKKEERHRLAFFIYYPTDMLNKYQNRLSTKNYEVLLKNILTQMVELARILATKYTKSKVRKTLPLEFSYIIQELLYESSAHEDKMQYYEAILEAIFKTEREKKLIVEMSRFIRNLAIDRLHIVGDIFDRGPKPHLVMEKMMKFKNIDIQWGNHDIIWMGAASGSSVCIANVIRIAARYNNLDCLEDGYGINLRPLASFANKTYKNDPCTEFYPKTDHTHDVDDHKYVARMHKAISIIQFKLEQEVVLRNPNFDLKDRLLLHKINPEKGTITINGEDHTLNDTMFPTVKFDQDPYRLTLDERQVVKHLEQAFLHNEMLQKHVKFLYHKGSMVLKTNDVLLFHAGVPLNDDGSFMKQAIDGKEVFGKALFDLYEKKIRHAYLNRYARNNDSLDYFMMLWQGKTSPLFTKDAMKTFERYFINDKIAHKEVMNPYYKLRENKAILDAIFTAFNVDPKRGKIINGHVPLDVTRGHEVVLADKRIYLIDGGMSKQYAKQTNIGGYTLISDSYAYYLVSHSRFQSYERLIREEEDIVSVTHSEDLNSRRSFIYDTDKGKKLQETIDDLAHLIEHYRKGLIKERTAENNKAIL